MIGRFINKVWPLKEFLNYIFKKTLGDYILNDLDLNKIEVEITNNTFISLTNIDLNAHSINNKHLKNSPIKMLEGRINRLDLIVSSKKIEFKIEEVFILLMPVLNVEKLNVNFIKKMGVTINSDNNVESSLISNFLNTTLGNLEISVKNICIKILTYEVFNNHGNNPCISFFIYKLEYKPLDKDKEKSSTNEETIDKLFIFNKQIILDKLCVKLNTNIKNDEVNFFNICNLNDEKLLFNFYCDNSTIFATNYSNSNDLNNNINSNCNDCSFYVNLLENECDGLKIELILKKLEFFVNPLQLQLIVNFVEVCSIIFKKNTINNIDVNEKSVNSNTIRNLKIFNYKISKITIDIYLDMFNIIITENKYSYEMPKLWSFYEINYSKKLRTIENLESHFSYTEDNFFILCLNKFQFKLKFGGNKENFDMIIHSFYIRYIEHKNKISNKNSNNIKKLKFSNLKSSGFANVNRPNNNSIYSNNKNNYRNDCNSIYQTIYSSVMSAHENSFSNSSINSNMFESAMESGIILVEKFNKLFDYDYFYYSNSIVNLLPQYQSDSICFEMKIKKESDSNNHQILVNFTLGDLNLDIHPCIFFKLSKLIFPNVILNNEFLFYTDNSNSNLPTEEMQRKVDKLDSLVNNNNNSKGNYIFKDSTKTEDTFPQCKRQIQILILLNEIKISIFNFINDQSIYTDNVVSSYFTEFYKNNISIVDENISNNSFKNKINIVNENLIQNLKSKENVLFKLVKTELLIDIEKIEKIQKSQVKRKINTNINISQLFVYFNDFLILNYKKGKKLIDNNIQISKINPYTVIINKNRHQNNDYSTDVFNSDIESNFKSNRIKFIDSLVSIELYDVFSIEKKFNFSKRIKSYLTNLYSLFKKPLKLIELKKISDCTNDNGSFSRIIVNFKPKEKINFFTEIKYLISINKFLETLMFTLNVYKILNRTIKKNYLQLKMIIFNSYNIYCDNVYKNDLNISNCSDSSINSFKMVNFSIEKINIYININKSQILSLSELINLNFSLITRNEENEVFMSLNLFKILLNKNENLNITIRNIYQDENEDEILLFDENEYHLLVYRGDITECSNIFNLEINYKELKNDSLNDNLTIHKLNNEVMNFEKYLNRSLINLNDLKVNLLIELNDIVISPCFFEINFFKEISTILNNIKKDKGSTQVHLFQLIKKRTVDLKLSIVLSTILIDLLYTNVNLEKKKWMRLLIVIGKIIHEKGKEIVERDIDNINYHILTDISKLYLHNLHILFLTNLDYLDADDTLINKIKNIGMENSILKKYGFVEIANSDKLELTSLLFKDEYSEITLNLHSIEVNFCKDSFSFFGNFVHQLKEKYEEIIKLFKLYEVKTDLIPLQEPNLPELLPEKNTIQIYDDYCEGGDYMKDVIMLNDADAENVIRKRKKSSFDMVQRPGDIDNKDVKGNTVINIRLFSFCFHIFKGKDFDFIDFSNGKSNISSNSKNANSKISDSMTELFFIEDYYKSKQKENFYSNNNLEVNRERRKNKDYHNHVEISIQNFILECFLYLHSDTSINNNLKIFTGKLSLSKFEIADYVKNSKYKKLLSKYCYDESNPNEMFELKAELYKSENEIQSNLRPNSNNQFINNSNIEDSVLYIDITISPINFLIDQYTLLMLLDFFNLKLSNSAKENIDTFDVDKELQYSIIEKEELYTKSMKNERLIFVRKIQINEFFINFSYNSHSVSISKIKNQNYLELLNLSNISDFRIIFKKFNFLGCKTLFESFEILLNFWKEDITKNQIFTAILSSVSVIRPFTTMFEGFLDIFKMPWMYYKTEKSLKDGFTKGIKNFILSFTSQSLFLGEKVIFI